MRTLPQKLRQNLTKEETCHTYTHIHTHVHMYHSCQCQPKHSQPLAKALGNKGIMGLATERILALMLGKKQTALSVRVVLTPARSERNTGGGSIHSRLLTSPSSPSFPALPNILSRMTGAMIGTLHAY